MKLTCAQMDVLISFYIDGDLSNNLKSEVEEHLKNCSNCRAKFDIIKSMLSDLKNCFNLEDEVQPDGKFFPNESLNSSRQYKFFKTNLSAYLDNELPTEENIKIKKFTINNKQARRDLEENYSIRKLMNDSFKKTKNDTRVDFSRNVLKQLEIDEENLLGIHPVIKILIGFTLAVLVITSLVLTSFSV